MIFFYILFESIKVCGMVYILQLSTIVIVDFRIVPTVWYFYVFHFIGTLFAWIFLSYARILKVFLMEFHRQQHTTYCLLIKKY